MRIDFAEQIELDPQTGAGRCEVEKSDPLAGIKAIGDSCRKALRYSGVSEESDFALTTRRILCGPFDEMMNVAGVGIGGQYLRINAASKDGGLDPKEKQHA
jgi:hypothetical protein